MFGDTSHYEALYSPNLQVVGGFPVFTIRDYLPPKHSMNPDR